MRGMSLQLLRSYYWRMKVDFCDLIGMSACSVAASYKPPMLVTRVRLPACAVLFVNLLPITLARFCVSCIHLYYASCPFYVRQ